MFIYFYINTLCSTFDKDSLNWLFKNCDRDTRPERDISLKNKPSVLSDFSHGDPGLHAGIFPDSCTSKPQGKNKRFRMSGLSQIQQTLQILKKAINEHQFKIR